MSATKLEYTFKSDVLFKMLFVKYPHLLKRLIAVLLSIPLESMSHFEIINTEIPPEEIGKKFCILDVNMTVNDKRVNLEVQVENEGNYPERTLFHWARDFSSALPAGHNYLKLPQTIVISFLGFKQFNCKEVRSEFQPLEIARHEPLSDKMRIIFYELPKLPSIEATDLGDEKALWLALFNAETEEELEKLSTNGGVIMSQAIEAYRGITATNEFRSLERLRMRTQHDEAQALENARRKERELWQDVATENERLNMENEKLRAQLAELQGR